MSPPSSRRGAGPEEAGLEVANGAERWRRVAWSLFLASLVALVLASTFYRREDRRPMADEATVLMQAASLAWDYDLRYDRGDHDRELFRWRGQPERLDLSWGPGETPRVGFDSPALGAVVLAPFLRGWPRHGFALANALALSLALALVATSLVRSMAGRGGHLRAVVFPLALLISMALSPLVVAVFRGRLEVLALAFSLMAVTRVVSARRDRSAFGIVAAGVLSLPACLLDGAQIVVVAWLLWWLATSTPRAARSRSLLLFGAGLALGLLVELGLDGTLGVGSTIGGRGGFTTSTGFPGVDFEASAENLDRHAHGPTTTATGSVSIRTVSIWTVVDLLVGRSGGTLVLFPAVVPIVVWALLAGRWSVLWVVFGWLGLTAGLRPFDLGNGWVAGGPAFLPIYGALVVIALAEPTGVAPWAWDRGWRRRVAGLVALAAVAWGVVVLWPIWSQPWRIPELGPRAHLATSTAWLPAVTTQRPVASRRGSLAGLDVLVVGEGAWIESRSERLLVEEPIELWVVASEPLDAIVLEVLDGGPAPRIEGARLVEAGTDAVGWWLDLPAGRRHPLAWTEGPRWVYRWNLDPVVQSTEPRVFGLHRPGESAAVVVSGPTQRETR